MDIDQARLEKAREIAAGISGFAWLAVEGHDTSAITKAALAALTLCDWQPPEDPDERAAYAIYCEAWQVRGVDWEDRHNARSYRIALAAYKAGKQSTNGDK